jgi:hypothetical protein
MESISFADVLTIIYFLVDEWLQRHAPEVVGKVGRPKEMSESELLTLMLASEMLGFDGERRYLAFMRANYAHLFPRLLQQSEFNRRARSAAPLLEKLRQEWLGLLWCDELEYFIMDTKAVPVAGLKRAKGRSDFYGSAAYGRSVSRGLTYWGYKLVLLTTPSGLPVAYELVPANCSDQAAAEEVIDAVYNSAILADKGFIGQQWHARWFEETGNQVHVPPRVNQDSPYTPEQERWLHAKRQRIEGAFHELTHIGRHLEQMLAKTVQGLAARLATKMTANTLFRLLRVAHGVDVVSWQRLPAS